MAPYLFIFVGLAFCYFYIIIAQFFTRRKCNFVHETAVAILVGALFGLIINFIDPSFFTNVEYEADFRDVAILILLPPMLFEDGYNIRKRKFFENIFYINLYGIIGTILNFFTIFGIVYAFSASDLLSSVSDITIHLKNWQIVAFASVMCSIDTVVPEKVVNPERCPKLFSIIFGESIIKDTVAVTLFDTTINVYYKYGGPNNDLDWSSQGAGMMVLVFMEVFICSILIGITAGIITTLVFKHMRFLLAEKGVAEVALILITGYTAYILSQWASFSGVISMLFCGITLSHFNIYNLSSEGRISTKIAVSSLALVAESLLFFALGIMAFDVQTNEDETSSVFYSFSWNFLLVGLLAMLVARFVNIYFVSLLGYLIIGKKKWRINRYEIEILMISGLVKGAVPFALILSLPEGLTLASSSVQNTTISIVILTSLVLNSVMSKFLRNRQDKLRLMTIQNIHHPSVFDSQLVRYVEQNKIIEKKSKRGSEKESDADFMIVKKMKHTTKRYWRKFEEGCLKPLLIHDYLARKDEIKEEKIAQRKKQAEEYWKRLNLDPNMESEDQESNKFIDLELIEEDIQQAETQQKQQNQSSDLSEKAASENGYMKRKTSKNSFAFSQVQRSRSYQTSNLKNQPSKTELMEISFKKEKDNKVEVQKSERCMVDIKETFREELLD